MVTRSFIDDERRLPWKREAYRLWFEFLKLALRDPHVTVSEQAYERWDDVANGKFDQWWSVHWEELFSVAGRTKEISDKNEWLSVHKDQNRIAISLPLDCDIKGTLKDLRKLLRNKGAGTLARIRQGSSAAPYTIAAKNLKYPALRQLLRIYGYWCQSGGDLDDTARRYYNWARNTNAKRIEWEKRRKQADKEPYWMIVPEAGWETYMAGDPDDRRRHMRRYLKKARKIAENVSSGVFPGKF